MSLGWGGMCFLDLFREGSSCSCCILYCKLYCKRGQTKRVVKKKKGFYFLTLLLPRDCSNKCYTFFYSNHNSELCVVIAYRPLTDCHPVRYLKSVLLLIIHSIQHRLFLLSNSNIYPSQVVAQTPPHLHQHEPPS